MPKPRTPDSFVGERRWHPRAVVGRGGSAQPGPNKVVGADRGGPINPSDLGLPWPAPTSGPWRSGFSRTSDRAKPRSRRTGCGGSVRRVGSFAPRRQRGGRDGDPGWIVRVRPSAGGQDSRPGRRGHVLPIPLRQRLDLLILPTAPAPLRGRQASSTRYRAGMIGTMRREGHTALVHTAAASNLGQMLKRSCSPTAWRW